MKDDRQKVDVFNNLGREYFMEDDKENSLFYAEAGRKLAQQIHYKIGEAVAVRHIGNIHYLSADYQEAIKDYKISLSISEQEDYKDGIASAVGNIGGMYNEMSNYDRAIFYYQKSLETYEEMGDRAGMGLAYNNIGLAYTNLSDYPKAIDAFQEAIKIGENSNDQALLVKSLNNIGLTYTELQEYQKALDYTQEALNLYQRVGNQKGEAYALNNLGNITAKMSNYKDKRSLEYYQRSLSLAEQINDKMSISLALSSMGEFYFYSGDYQKALSFSKSSLKISRQISDKNGMAYEFNSIANSYIKLPDSSLTQHHFDLAMKYADSALAINKEIGNVSGQKDVYKTLTDIYLAQNDYRNLYFAFKNYVVLNDSVQGQKVKNEILRKELQFDFEKKTAIAQEEQEKKDITQRNIRTSLLLGVSGLLLFSGLIARQRNKLKREKRRSENLLLNILPIEVADELKQTGKARARKYDNISILFTDFVNFTKTSETLSPETLIEELNECFTAFDYIMERNGLEKIKTIGDAYMAVCGLPNPTPNHAQNTVRAALEIAHFIHERSLKERVFGIRIGINSGAVVAGIVGVKKFAYDIWGDSVNIAARMEQNGESGKINISESTYQLVKNDFICYYRGEIEAKNKGGLRMYFVDGPKTETGTSYL